MEDKALLLSNQRRDPHVEKNVIGKLTRLIYSVFHQMFDFYLVFAAEQDIMRGSGFRTFEEMRDINLYFT